MPYIGKSPTAVPLSASDLDDDIISLAKLASGTDGNLITYDASGNPVAVATGDDGQVLTSAGAGQPCAFEAAAGGGSTPVVSAYASDGSNQTVTTSTWTQVVFGTEEVDSDGAFASNTFTVPSGEGGNYMVSTHIRYSLGASTTQKIAIYKEGSNYIEKLNWRSDGVIEKNGHLSAIINLDAAETIKIYNYHTRGIDNTIHGDSTRSTRVDIFKVN
jgi:uncharacterized protein GlcG (DUF336 family)